jgi:hypothetical protein
VSTIAFAADPAEDEPRALNGRDALLHRGNERFLQPRLVADHFRRRTAFDFRVVGRKSATMSDPSFIAL